MGDVLTLAEVAARMKVSRRTVDNWVASGRLSVVRIGGVVRVEPSAVEALVASGRASRSAAEA